MSEITFYKCTKCIGNDQPCIMVIVGVADKPKVCPVINEEDQQSEWVGTNEYVIGKRLTK